METLDDFEAAAKLVKTSLRAGWRTRLTPTSAAELSERVDRMVSIANHLTMAGTMETHAAVLAKALKLARPAEEARAELVPLLTKPQLKWFDGALKGAQEAWARLEARPKALAEQESAATTARDFYRSATKLDRDRMDMLDDAISIAFDGAPAEAAEEILATCLAERRRLGDAVTRADLLTLAIHRFGHEYDFRELAEAPTRTPSKRSATGGGPDLPSAPRSKKAAKKVRGVATRK